MPIGISGQHIFMPESIFSRNLAAALKQRGVRQAELATAIGCKQSDISRYLQGRIPSGDKLVALAGALGLSAEDLLSASSVKFVGGGDAGDWRRRAETAERKLESLKRALTSLVNEY